jgi:hypothetical protein
MKALIGGLSPATGYRAIDPHIVTGTSADCGCVLPPGVEPAYPRPRLTAAGGPAPSFGSAA